MSEVKVEPDRLRSQYPEGCVQSEMNRDFLYKKAYPIGFLDDNEDDMEALFIEDSKVVFENMIRESLISELLIELIGIVRNGSPNYIQLALLFGF